MKKTQSLKLMLLGLMASAGMNAWAAVGDVFSDNTSCLFFEELDGGKARVVGVTNVVNGIVTIPDQTSNPFDNSNNPLSVTEVSNDWYGKSEIELRHYDGDGNLVKETTTQVKDLSKWPTPFKLIVDATQLKKINALALIPLNGKINGFEVTSRAGLEEIDDFSFANPGDVATLNDKAVQDYADAMMKAKEDAAKAKEDLTYAIGRQPAIVNGKYNGKGEWAEFNGQDVYRWLKYFEGRTNEWIDITDGCPYVLLGKEIDGTRDKFGYKQREIWEINLTTGALIKKVTTARLHYQADGVTPSGDLCYADADGNVVLGVASKLTADNACGDVNDNTLTSTPADAVPGLQDEADAAGTLYSELLKARADFNAIKENPSTVSSEIKNRVPNGWVAAHLFVALSAAEDAMEDAIDELFKAYGTRTVGDDGVVPFTSTSPYAAWQNFPATSAVGAAVEQGLVDVNGVYDPDNRISVTYDDENGTSKTTELNEAQFNAAQRIMNVMDDAGYTRVNGGFPRPSFSNIRDRVITTTEAYEKLEEMSEDLIAYDNDKPAVESDGTPIKEIEEGATFYYGQDQAEGLTLAQVIAAIPGARAASDAAKQALREAKQDLADAEDTIEALKNKDRQDFVDEARLDPENYDHSYTAGTNTVLKNVDIEKAPILKEIGESAFQNCKDAVFAGTAKLPVTTVNIAPRAFFNTSIAPIFGKLVNLETIGDEAFANSKATTANFQNSPKLYALGEHVFDNCKLTNLLLKGTAIEADPEGPKYPEALAQYLYLETPKFVDDCGYFYNYDVTKAEDVAELKALGFSDEEIGANVTDPKSVGFGWRNGGEAKVNMTLKKVNLPVNIKKIPDAAFMNDVALENLDGGIPATVTYIGDMAFFRTKINKFDLTNNVNLTSVGSQAFAGNSELTKVILPQGDNAKLTTLGAGVFECDGDLEEVVLSPDITCLPEGTFAGNNKIATLDLSNTKIEVLYNLFGTKEVIKENQYGENYKEELANTKLTKIILPKQVINETDNYTELIPGLKVIMPNALAYMQGLTEVEIPSSVFWMGDGVFYNDKNLKTVKAIDSRLTTIGANTFRNCRALEEFYFVTLKMANNEDVDLYDLINSDDENYALTNDCGLEGIQDNKYVVNAFLDDHNFFVNNKVKVYMSPESIDNIRDYFKAHGFTNLIPYEFTLATHTDGTLPYFNSDYATWIKMDQADVYTCYQDEVDQTTYVYMVKAKHNQGFYKIPAATIYELRNPDGSGHNTYNWRPSNSVYEFPGYNDTFMDWYIDGPEQTYNSEDGHRMYTPSAAAIIIEKADGGADGIKGQVPYERHSDSELIRQSTLDPGNQMKITRKPLDKLSSSSNIMWYAHAGNEPNTWHGPIIDGVIPAGKLVLPISAGQANGNVRVIWLDEEITGIMDVKDYIKSLRDSEAIYNLQGVKVTAPVKGQMYIQGGKKFIQK